MTSRIRVVAVLLSIAAVSCVIPEKREFFAELNYPEDDPKDPGPRDFGLSVSATVLPMLVVAYTEPARAGACLDGIARQPGTPETLFEHGRCLAKSNNADERSQCLASLPWLRRTSAASPSETTPGSSRAPEQPSGQPSLTSVAPGAAGSAPRPPQPAAAPAVAPYALALPAVCTEGLAVPDQRRMVQALAQSGEALLSYTISLYGQAAVGRPMPPPLRAPFIRSLSLAAGILAMDAPQGRLAQARKANRINYPVLALSGGAANGAFTAGYVHALLQLRELAIAANPSQTDRLLQALRFGASAGASVGALVSLPIDLYFSDWPEDAPPAKRAALATALSACLRDAGAGSAGTTAVDPDDPVKAAAAVRRCALRRLQADFQQNEWDVLCAEDGTMLDLIESSNHALGFQPLMDGTVHPFVRDFGELITNNDFVRVATVVDLNQNVVVGLDERACKLSGMPTAACLEQAVLASISEPVFVSPVKTVYSGLEGGRGEVGAWLDGGLRSGTPAARAIDLGQRRVLAINTNRAEGLVGAPPPAALAMIFSSLGSAVDQARQWEMAYAQLHRRAQDQRACELRRLLEIDPDCGAEMIAAPAVQVTGDLMAVYVPEDIKPSILSASGYTFDPATMRGLFLWGQKSFLDARERVLSWLEWHALAELEGKPGPYKDSVRSFAANVDREVAALARLGDKAVQRKNREKRRALVEERLKECGHASAD